MGAWTKAGFSFLARPYFSYPPNACLEKHPSVLPERRKRESSHPLFWASSPVLFSAHVFLLPSAQTAIQSCQFYLVNPFRASCPLSHLNLSCAWHTLDAQLSVPGVLERSLYFWVLSPTSWYFAMNFLKHGAIFFLCEYLLGLFLYSYHCL